MEIKTGKDLLVLINENQVRAFTAFYQTFFQKLLLAADRHVKDMFVAEEIVQDVFLKVWENPDNLQEVKSVKSYLYRSVLNASINYVNRQKNIELHHQKIAAETTEQDLTDLDDQNEMIVVLHKEIDKLPRQCQKIFKLNRFEQLKYKEIAALLEISERTVENHIATALKILRKALSDKKMGNKSNSGYNLLMSLFLY